MTKSTTTKTAPVMVLNFTAKGSSERGGSTACHYNPKLRRLSIPASRIAKGVKSYDIAGIAGVDALCLTPAKEGRSVHPTQRFVTVPANLAEALKSTSYSIYEPGDGDSVVIPEGVLVLLGDGVGIDAVIAEQETPAVETPAVETPAK